MNFLIEFSTVTYKLKHAVIKRLKELYPESKFAGIIGVHPDIEKYLKEQKDVKYEFLRRRPLVLETFLNQEIDYDKLRKFEELTPEKSLWRFIAVDRAWGNAFVKTAYRPRKKIYVMANNENILKVCYGYLKYFEEIIDKFKPDVVLPSAGMSYMGGPILEQLCKNMKINYLLPETVRTFNYMAITSNRKYTYPHIDKTYKDLIEEKIKLDNSKGEECYKKLMSSFDNNSYFDKPSIMHLDKKFPKLRFLINSLRAIAYEPLKLNKERILARQKGKIHNPSYDLKTLWSNICFAVRRQYQKMKFFDTKFYSEFDPTQKYIFLPLHNTPEYSTQVRAPMWINQLIIIEALAKSIPVGWQLYVKEHPGTLLTRVRQPSFYNEIKGYPNVRLIPISMNNSVIIKNAQLVMNTSGTTGWEAIQAGKPVISLAENIYDVMNLSVRCTDIEKLSVVIHDEIKRIKQISSEERKKRIVCFLTAMLKHSFWVDNPLQVTGDAECDDTKNHQIGEIIGNKIKDYLDEYSCKLMDSNI